VEPRDHQLLHVVISALRWRRAGQGHPPLQRFDREGVLVGTCLLEAIDRGRARHPSLRPGRDRWRSRHETDLDHAHFPSARVASRTSLLRADGVALCDANRSPRRRRLRVRARLHRARPPSGASARWASLTSFVVARPPRTLRAGLGTGLSPDPPPMVYRDAVPPVPERFNLCDDSLDCNLREWRGAKLEL